MTEIPIPSAPGPAPFPGIGARGNIMYFLGRPLVRAGELFARYGKVASIVRAPVRMANPGPGWGTGALATATGMGVVLVTGAEHNREVLTHHDRFHMIALPGSLYPTGDVPSRRRPLTRLMTGLFHVNGDEHRRHRRLLMPAFHKTRIDAYRDDMVRLTEGVIGRYQVGETRDVHRDMTELTLSIATKTLFGEDAGKKGVALARMMQEWLLTMFSPVTAAMPYDLPHLPFRRFLDLSHAIDRATVEIVRERREHTSPGAADMLSMLLAARDEDGSAFSEDDLIGHTGVIFAAGHETSTNALAWTLLLLSQHPRVAGELEDEITATLRGGAPSVEDLGKMPLLDAVVKESMRVLPPVPLHPRIVAEDTELGGHFLPAGSEIYLSIFHMHHDPAVFSEPERFLPHRWETIKPSVYEYNPFSAGPRMCIGASFAMMEIKLVLAMLLQRWRAELPDGARVDPRVAITMAPQGGLPMTLRPRTHARRPTGRARGKIREVVALG